MERFGNGDGTTHVTGGTHDFKTLKMLEEQQDLLYIEDIDKGSFGSVFEVRHRLNDEKIAAKLSVASKVSKGDKIIWPTLLNEHLVPLLSSYYFKSTDTYVFTMKKYQTTLLKQVEDIHFRKDVKGFRRAESYLKDVVDGLLYMHSRGICHADLKTNNVLIDERDVASICDFGYAQKPLLLIDNYGVPVTYCPPEAKQVAEGRALINGFHLDQYALGMLALEVFTYHSLVRTVGQRQKDTLKFSWSSDVYPVLFEILQPTRFKALVKTAHMMSNISSSSMLDILNVIKSLVCLDPSKRATVLDVSKYRLFGGKVKNFQEDEIWMKKVNPEELEKMIGISAPNPLVNVENLLEQRKSHAACVVFEKSFESELNRNKANEQKASSSSDAEFKAKVEEELSDKDVTRPLELCSWFRRKISWIRSIFATCKKRKSRK